MAVGKRSAHIRPRQRESAATEGGTIPLAQPQLPPTKAHRTANAYSREGELRPQSTSTQALSVVGEQASAKEQDSQEVAAP